MKKHLTIVFLLAFFSVFAQKITVTGTFNKNYRTINLSENIKKALFVLEKANIYLPERGYFLDLSLEDAKKLKTETILLIPFNQEIGEKYDTPLTFELLPIPNLPEVYYTKSYWKRSPSIISQIKRKKPFYYDEFNNRDDFQNTDYWITAINNPQKTKVIYLSSEDAECGVSEVGFQENIKNVPLSTLAKEKLEHLVYLTYDLGTIPKKDTQKDWQRWLQQIYNYKFTPIKNTAHIEPLSNNIGFEEVYATLDTVTQHIYLLHEYDIDALKRFDTTTGLVQRGKIWSESQPNARDFVTVYAESDTLYTLNRHLCWAKYVPTLTANNSLFYREIASLALPFDKNYNIQQSYSHSHYTYLLLQQQNTSVFKLLCLQTKTGKLIGETSINTLLNNPKKLEYRLISDTDMQKGDAFAVLFKTEQGVYHLKFKQTKCTENVYLGNVFRWATNYLQWNNQQYHAGKEEGNFVLYNIASPSQTIVLSDSDYNTDKCLFTTNNQHIAVFFEFDEGFYQGVKMQLFSKQTLKPIDKPKVLYQYFPEEEVISANNIRNFKAFWSAGKWNVLFMKEKELFFCRDNQ